MHYSEPALYENKHFSVTMCDDNLDDSNYQVVNNMTGLVELRAESLVSAIGNAKMWNDVLEELLQENMAEVH